jgi:Enoyl-CoA hydratase/isomerase
MSFTNFWLSFTSLGPVQGRPVRSLPEPCEEVISGRTGPPRCLATEARKGRARPVACELDEIPDGPPDVKNGIAPGDGGAVLWPFLIGFHRAKEYIMLGEPIDGPKAAEIGLINYCVPDEELDRAVDDMANKCFTDTQGPPASTLAARAAQTNVSPTWPSALSSSYSSAVTPRICW